MFSCGAVHIVSYLLNTNLVQVFSSQQWKDTAHNIFLWKIVCTIYKHFESLNLSRLVRKPTICICENKDADQLTAKLICAFIFATGIVEFFYFLNPKFQASSHLLCLCSSVCVRPVQKPHSWFSHEAAQIYLYDMIMLAV